MASHPGWPLPRLAGWHDPFAAPAERFLLGQQVGSIASQRRASAPVTSGLLEDECISPYPVCAWAGTTPTGSPATRCRTPPSDRPPRRPSDDTSWEPAAIRGDSALAPRAPRPPGQGWVARRPPVPKGRHDNHRPEPWPCYAPGSRRGGTTPAAAAMAVLHRQMPGRPPARSWAANAARHWPSRRSHHTHTLAPLPDSSAVSHAFMIHPPGPCRRATGRVRRRPPQSRRSPSSELSRSG
jgi:hypothetical protein